MNHDDNTVDYSEIRRQIWQILADNDDISLYPSEQRFHWEVSVDGLGLRFEPIRLHDWSLLLMSLRACKGALDAAGDEMRAREAAIERQWEEEDRAKQEKKKQED